MPTVCRPQATRTVAARTATAVPHRLDTAQLSRTTSRPVRHVCATAAKGGAPAVEAIPGAFPQSRAPVPQQLRWKVSTPPQYCACSAG
jgi:hypothetical protein